MSTAALEKLLHDLKPDGHHCNPLVTELHKLANALQEQADKSHAALQTVLNPQFKGDVVGELHAWPEHYPAELDHTEGELNDIKVRNLSVWDLLSWEQQNEASAYIKERFGPDAPKSKIVQRMDAADRLKGEAA